VVQLQNGAEETSQTAADITQSLEEQKIASQEIARVVMQISSSADVNLRSAQAVGQASENMVAGVEQLSQQLARFKM
jgi:methyl-accepting chemotaxis protein